VIVAAVLRQAVAAAVVAVVVVIITSQVKILCHQKTRIKGKINQGDLPEPPNI